MPYIHVCMHAGSQTLHCMACTRINIDIYAHVHINMNTALVVLYCLIILYNTAEDHAGTLCLDKGWQTLKLIIIFEA